MSCGERFLIASRNRCARAPLIDLVAAVGDDGLCKGDKTGVSGGVASPMEGCVVAVLDTVTVAIT